MTSEKEFQQKIQRLGTLVGELEQALPAGSNIAVKELVKLLMEVHGAGLERMMEVIFESGTPGEGIIAKIGADPITRNLLLLYSLHPDSLDTRVATALEKAKGRLRKLGGEVELIAIHDGAVEVRLRGPEHSCGSTARNLGSLLEECIYEPAPDVTSVTILSPEAETSGFVALDALLANPRGSAIATERS